MEREMAWPANARPDAQTSVRLRLEAAGASDVGRMRAINEDAFLVAPEFGLYAVADGVGGRPGGQIASRIAVEHVLTAVSGSSIAEDAGRRSASALRARLVAAVEEANHAILSSPERPEGGMATTFAGVLIDADAFCVAHLGDSRIYRFRDDNIEPLTADHTVANEAIWRGEPVERALARPNRGALTRALGADLKPKVTARIASAQPGDMLLLCTDGLYRLVPDAAIEEVLFEAEHVGDAVERLIQRAIEGGGKDNVTVVVVRWVAIP